MNDDDFLDEDDEESLGDFDFDDQEEFDEEIAPPTADTREPIEELTEEQPFEEPTEEEPPKQESPQPEKAAFVSPADLPVQLKIELDRLEMSADKLLHLQPGNFLELARAMDQGVDLVINGERIGRGELIRIGEAIGVRVTELG